MIQPLKPALWLILIIVGLPIFSETVYTPSLPDIARALSTTEAMTEYTLTIYLFGFAIGTFFWGKLSDKAGRKPCVAYGILIYILGCVGCYFSRSIEMLMLSRFVQAFGGSVGSVLGQAICRDSFHGPALGKVYSSIGSALSIFPAVGPIIGGLVAEKFGWSYIFLLLAALGSALYILVMARLLETHPHEQRSRVSIKSVILHMIKDRNLVILTLIVGGCNGISFSYFAEGSFYLIEMLGLSPSHYGLSFVMLAGGAFLGGMLSKKLHDRSFSSHVIMSYGLRIVFIGSLAFSVLILYAKFIGWSKLVLIAITLVSYLVMVFGICMTNSNALAIALTDYKWCVGTASSLFGFGYYCVISLCTLVMGMLHNGTLLPMPIYFLVISSVMVLANKSILRR